MESGPGGKDRIEGKTGDFVKIPSRTVHRESNPSDEESVAIIVRIGKGPVVVNVAGPEKD